MNKWIKKQDRVRVIAGNHKGKVGTVLSRKEEWVVVQGINLRKKHMKKSQQNQTGQILEREQPVHISNICFCNDKGDPISVKVRTGAHLEKELFYVEGEKEIVLRTIKKGS